MPEERRGRRPTAPKDDAGTKVRTWLRTPQSTRYAGKRPSGWTKFGAVRTVQCRLGAGGSIDGRASRAFGRGRLMPRSWGRLAERADPSDERKRCARAPRPRGAAHATLSAAATLLGLATPRLAVKARGFGIGCSCGTCSWATGPHIAALCALTVTHSRTGGWQRCDTTASQRKLRAPSNYRPTPLCDTRETEPTGADRARPRRASARRDETAAPWGELAAARCSSRALARPRPRPASRPRVASAPKRRVSCKHRCVARLLRVLHAKAPGFPPLLRAHLDRIFRRLLQAAKRCYSSLASNSSNLRGRDRD